MIRVRGLSKEFGTRDNGGGVLALSDIDFEVHDNEFVTVIGPSGCGKTTLLRIIAGLIPYDQGQVAIDGRAITGPGPERAVVFQNFALLPWADVLANITFGLEVRGTPPNECRDKARDLIKLVGLARALAVNPQILLMDEPFGALDEQTRRLLQEQLLQLWQEQRKTVIFVTHSMDEAVMLGDRVMLMTPRPGKVKEMIDVPLQRPCSSQVEKSGAFVEIKEYLR